MKSTRLLLAGGGCLAFGVAFTNTGFVLHTQTSVSHLTGNIAKLSIGLAYWSAEIRLEIFRIGVAAFCFFLGALLAGIIIHHPSLDFSRPYGRAVSSIGILLLVAHGLPGKWQLVSIALAALGCGLQNALASHYRGIVLRTTHITGLMTDFGVTLGMRLRGHDIPFWKIAVPGYLITAFFCGGLCAAIVNMAGINPIPVAGYAYIIGGLGWSIWKQAPRHHQPSLPVPDRSSPPLQ